MAGMEMLVELAERASAVIEKPFTHVLARLELAEALVHQPTTRVLLVMSIREDGVAGARALGSALRQADMSPSAVLINQMMPESLSHELDAVEEKSLTSEGAAIRRYVRAYVEIQSQISTNWCRGACPTGHPGPRRLWPRLRPPQGGAREPRATTWPATLSRVPRVTPRLFQHIRGNASPTSQSRMRVPPNVDLHESLLVLHHPADDHRVLSQRVGAHRRKEPISVAGSVMRRACPRWRGGADRYPVARRPRQPPRGPGCSLVDHHADFGLVRYLVEGRRESAACWVTEDMDVWHDLNHARDEPVKRRRVARVTAVSEGDALRDSRGWRRRGRPSSH